MLALEVALTLTLFARKVVAVQGCLLAVGVDTHPFDIFVGIAVEFDLFDVEKVQHGLELNVPLMGLCFHEIDKKSTD